jgi:hypothetical protein
MKANKMKFTLVFFGLTLVLSSCSTVSGIEAVVVRDCTGTYVRVEGKDHLVCNRDKLKAFETGDTVRVRFKKTTYCQELKDEIVCMMYHEHEGMVKLIKVNPK